MPRKKTLEGVSERRRIKRLAETPEQRQQRLASLRKNEKVSRIRRRIDQLLPEQNLVENLPEPGIEPRISSSMENMCSHEEPETGRRPSRKAALVAAKKIFNTVRSFNVNDDPSDVPASTTTSPKPTSTPHPYTRPNPKKIVPVNVDLQMECCDDLLSPTQAEFLMKTQIQYNMVMKNLRELMACNVKVIQTDPFGLPMPTPVAPVSNVVLKTINVPSNVNLSRTNPIRVGTLVVPVAFSCALSQSSPKL